ncbi:hypothetical protein [Streptomyces sp. TLI_171]|uniref:hypothetical protein n=1 Tax=Streptomyces sp. TLI_171 TaxID=1938859 RepID=UPI000C1963CA|nr:hypothetical protein [Streptomyces sp. TLI_171]RKE21914.1 hypothetical protein BX266_5320 [Streptomyces sp. TLI_171]
MSTVYPYPTLVGRIDVDVRQAGIDGKALPFSLISKREQVVALHLAGRDDWAEATLELEVALPDDELADGPWAAVGCVAVLTEGTTNARTVTRLERRRGDTRWRGEVRVRRSMYVARAVLQVSVVGSYDGIDGRVIGTGDLPWVVDLLARAAVRQRDIEIVQEDFRDGPQDWLRPFKDAPWLVETAGELPTVLLNSSFEGLGALLDGARGPLEKAAAGLIATQIAGDAWTAMFHSAVGDLEVDEDGTPQVPDGWKEPVLRAMLPDVFPGLPLVDALVEIHSRRTEGHGWAELQSRIQFAASRRAQTPKNLTTALRALSRPQEGGTR